VGREVTGTCGSRAVNGSFSDHLALGPIDINRIQIMAAAKANALWSLDFVHDQSSRQASRAKPRLKVHEVNIMQPADGFQQRTRCSKWDGKEDF